MDASPYAPTAPRASHDVRTLLADEDADDGAMREWRGAEEQEEDSAKEVIDVSEK